VKRVEPFVGMLEAELVFDTNGQVLFSRDAIIIDPVFGHRIKAIQQAHPELCLGDDDRESAWRCVIRGK